MRIYIGVWLMFMVCLSAGHTQENNQMTFYLPTGEPDSSLLRVDQQADRQLRLGAATNVDLILTNTSRERLIDVTVVANLGQGLELDNVQLPEQAQQQQGQQQQGQQQQGQQQQGQQQQGQQQQGQMTWQLGEIFPNQSQRIRLTVIPTQEGATGICLAVTFEPAICTLFEVVSPNLQVLKNALETAWICDEFIWRYSVRNTGSGPARDVMIEDPLPEGLQTAEGSNQVRIEVGTLEPDELQYFDVALRARNTGRFASRATARSATDEVRSNQPETYVVEPQLAIDVQAPQWTYADTPVNFDVTVRNTGNVAADQTVVLFQTESLDGDDARREIGRLDPGAERRFQVTLPGRSQGEIRLAARVNAYCARQPDEELVARAATPIRTMPALLIETYDQLDPVRVGQQTSYQIMVKNQGNAPATNVMVTIEVPQQLSIDNITGDAQGQIQGQNIQIGPLDVRPGDVLSWQLLATAQTPGDVRLRTELSSDYLERPVPDVEPTRIY